jgi:uncharacterized SAM-binding protein YcdF (DUF218 family)
MKFLVNPLFLGLLLQSIGLLILHRRVAGRGRVVVRALLVLMLLLATFSVPFMHRALEASLSPAPASDAAVSPTVIFVLGGGYVPGATPDEDRLVLESEARVVHGVSVWRRVRAARIVCSGAGGYEGIRTGDRLVQLMAESATRRGVPAANVSLEPRSRNTREHPIEALKLAGVTSSTPIGIVTSGWHMRRALREFRRRFQNVQPYPVPLVPQAIGWQDFIPDAEALDASTTLLREWVGLAWYSFVA